MTQLTGNGTILDQWPLKALHIRRSDQMPTLTIGYNVASSSFRLIGA